MHTKARSGTVKRLCSVVLIACALVVVLPLGAQAQGPSPCQVRQLGGQTVQVCMPPVPPTYEPWNGTLVVYAHGYVAPHMDLALPAEELGQIQLPGGAIGFLLSQGYAFATTSYSKNGWAVNAAEKDLNELVRYFKTRVLPNAGLLDKVLMVGASEGGLITTLMVEKYPGIYDGGLAMCGPIGGMPAQVKYLADFRVVFDVLFPGVFVNPPAGFPSFGVVDVPDVAAAFWDKDEPELDYLTLIPDEMEGDIGRVGALYDITGAPVIVGDLDTYAGTALQILYYSVVGTPDMLATAGGVPYDNMSTFYPGALGPLHMNDLVERVDGDGRAFAFARRAYQPTGELERPLVTIHNYLDPAVPFGHEVQYAARATPGMYQLYPRDANPMTDYGHCRFTSEEVQGAFALLLSKVGP